MKKAMQKMVGKVESGPYTYGEATATLVAFLVGKALDFWPMYYQWFGIPGYTPEKGADAAYTYIGKPDGHDMYYSYIMAVPVVLEFTGIVLTYVFQGNAKSGKNGHANDLASYSRQNFWPTIFFFLLPGIDGIVSTFIKGSALGNPGAGTPDGIVYSGNTDVGYFGAARGSLLDFFSAKGVENSWAFLVQKMIQYTEVGLGFLLAFQASQVFGNFGWTDGTAQLFWGFMGIGLTFGFEILHAGGGPIEVTAALTKNGDSGNFWVEIMTLLVPVSVFVIELMPIIFPEVLGTYVWAFPFLGIAVFQSLASMRIYGVPDSTNTNSKWQTYVKGDNTLATPNALYTTSWLPWSASTFEKVMSGVTIFGASFAGIMFLYLFFFDSPILV